LAKVECHGVRRERSGGQGTVRRRRIDHLHEDPHAGNVPLLSQSVWFRLAARRPLVDSGNCRAGDNNRLDAAPGAARTRLISETST
jgi:hypothetical protein